MAGRRKRFNAVAPIRVQTDRAGEGDTGVIEIDTGVRGITQLRFDPWLGRGIDPWVRALTEQLRVFLRGECVAPQTVITYARTGVRYFLEFLVSTEAKYMPGELDRARIEQFIEWLKGDSPAHKACTQNAIYRNVKTVLKGLARRAVIPPDSQLLPARRFPRSDLEYEREEPLSQAERARLAEALRTDIIALHHRANKLSDSEALAVYALALCLRTGLNTTPMLELKRDALTRHPFLPKMGLLRSVKRRSHAAQWMALAGEPLEETAAVPVDAVALFNALLERTRPLAEGAPEPLRPALWLYRSVSRNRQGQLRRLTVGTFAVGIRSFVQRHHLCADDGAALRLSNRRLRVTLENRLWKLSNGDLFTVSSIMGHNPKVADQHYLAVTAEMRAQATIVGEALPDLYRGASIDEPPRIERTPVGGCKDSLHGERAPKDGLNHCMDFFSCFRCRSYALVGSAQDLHRLFSFYWFLAAEKARIPSRAWCEHFAQLMSMIDAFTLDRFDNALVKSAKARARAHPLTFWTHYQPSSEGADGH